MTSYARQRQLEQMEAPNRWARENRELLSLIWSKFWLEDDWPDGRRLQRELFSQGRRFDVQQFAFEFPPALGRVDLSTWKIHLTPRALLVVEAARPVLDEMASLIRIAIERYADPSQDALISTGEFPDLLGLGPRQSRQLALVLLEDRWLFNAAGTSPEGWQDFRVDERTVLRIGHVRTIEDYMDAQAEAWYSGPRASPIPNVPSGTPFLTDLDTPSAPSGAAHPEEAAAQPDREGSAQAGDVTATPESSPVEPDGDVTATPESSPVEPEFQGNQAGTLDPSPLGSGETQRRAKPSWWKRHRVDVGIIATVIAAAAAIVIPLTATSTDSGSRVLATAPGRAGQVYAALEPGPLGEPVRQVDGQAVTYIDLYNNTGAPSYKAIVSLVFIQGGAWQTGRQLDDNPRDPARNYQRDVQIIPTGRSRISVSGDWGSLTARPGVEIAYQDESGRNWLRTALGKLYRLKVSPQAYYGLNTPLDWIEPTPVP